MKQQMTLLGHGEGGLWDKEERISSFLVQILISADRFIVSRIR